MFELNPEVAGVSYTIPPSNVMTVKFAKLYVTTWPQR
jgi:hypothetical protein